MPYYGMPIGLEIHGEQIEEVGFGYNKQIVTGLLRGSLGYDGVVVTDWELVNDNHVGGQVLPARAWGVEHLDPAARMELILEAGADQFGGEECVELLLDLVAQGRVTEARVDESARRLLAVKFRLGLFDDPFVDEDVAAQTLGRQDFRDAGYAAQARSVTVLTNRSVEGTAVLPLQRGLKVYAENVSAEAVATLGVAVDRPEDADVALVRLPAPFEPRSDLFLESWFHQGSLDYPPGLVARLARIAAHCPLVVDVVLDRPAVLTPLLPLASALVGSFGTNDDALVDALTGAIAPEGRLPFDLPRSMEQVRQPRRGRPRLRRPAVRLRARPGAHPDRLTSQPVPPVRTVSPSREPVRRIGQIGHPCHGLDSLGSGRLTCASLLPKTPVRQRCQELVAPRGGRLPQPR